MQDNKAGRFETNRAVVGALVARLEEAARKMNVEKRSGQEQQGDAEAAPNDGDPEPAFRSNASRL